MLRKVLFVSTSAYRPKGIGSAYAFKKNRQLNKGFVSAGTGRYGQMSNIGGVLDTDSRFPPVGPTLDIR